MATEVNEVSMWRSAALADTLFLRANFRDHRFQPHFHEEYAIGIIEDGCQAFSFDAKRRIDLPRGTVCLISPGMVHEGWAGAENGWTYRMFYPSVFFVEQAAIDIFGTKRIGFNSPAIDDPQLYEATSRLHQLAAAPHVDSIELETAYLATIRIAIERHGGRRAEARIGKHWPALKKVRDLLEDRFADDISLSELKDVAGLSKFHFLRQFKATFGLPPHAYLCQVRVRRASQLIAGGEGLAETAAAVGFADQAHMTHIFRRTLGYSPGLLKKAGRVI